MTFESTISIEDCDRDNLHIFLGIEPEPEQWLDVLSSPCFKSRVEISLDIFWDQFLEGGVDTQPMEMEGLYEDRCTYLLETMSTEMILLEKIRLRCALPSSGTAIVKRWKNLKSLIGVLAAYYYEDTISEEGGVEGGTAYVLEQFEDFFTKPEVLVRYIKWHDHGEDVDIQYDNKRFIFGNGRSRFYQ